MKEVLRLHGRRNTLVAENAWWRRCQRENRPYVKVVSRGRRLASVTVDLYCTDRDFTEMAVAQLRELLDRTMREYGVAGMVGSAGPDRFTITKVPAPVADMLAKTVPAFATAPIRLRHEESSTDRDVTLSGVTL